MSYRSNVAVRVLPTLALGLLTIPSTALADAYCSSTVPAQTLTYSNGRVTIFAPWRQDYTDICNTNVSWKGISTTTCLVWFAQVNNAQISGKGLIVYYAGISQSECATMPLYDNAPAPLFIAVQ